MQSFASVSALLDKVIQEEVHNEPKNKKSLYLVVSSFEPLHFFDISKIKLAFPQDDLETYLNSNPQITLGSTVCLQNCEVSYESGKEGDIVSCEIQSKNIAIEAGTIHQKHLKSCKIRIQVETDSGEIPLLPSTRRYIRRAQKQEIVRKELKKVQKTDLLSFFTPKNIPSKSGFGSNPFIQEIGPIDSESIKILEKLTNFVDKDELFNLLATKPLRNKIAKKAVRMMVIPNEKNSKNDDGLAYKKKMKEEVEELCRHYEHIDLQQK